MSYIIIKLTGPLDQQTDKAAEIIAGLDPDDSYQIPSGRLTVALRRQHPTLGVRWQGSDEQWLRQS